MYIYLKKNKILAHYEYVQNELDIAKECADIAINQMCSTEDEAEKLYFRKLHDKFEQLVESISFRKDLLSTIVEEFTLIDSKNDAMIDDIDSIMQKLGIEE